MSKFEAKKKLLVAESEVYRELLKLEFQTFKIYGKRAKRRLTSPGTYLPLAAAFELLAEFVLLFDMCRAAASQWLH